MQVALEKRVRVILAYRLGIPVVGVLNDLKGLLFITGGLKTSGEIDIECCRMHVDL